MNRTLRLLALCLSLALTPVAGSFADLPKPALKVKAQVNGDVHYQRLEIQGGAIVQGMALCDAAPHSDKVVPFKPASAEQSPH